MQDIEPEVHLRPVVQCRVLDKWESRETSTSSFCIYHTPNGLSTDPLSVVRPAPSARGGSPKLSLGAVGTRRGERIGLSQLLDKRAGSESYQGRGEDGRAGWFEVRFYTNI